MVHLEILTVFFLIASHLSLTERQKWVIFTYKIVKQSHFPNPQPVNDEVEPGTEVHFSKSYTLYSPSHLMKPKTGMVVHKQRAEEERERFLFLLPRAWPRATDTTVSGYNKSSINVFQLK